MEFPSEKNLSKNRASNALFDLRDEKKSKQRDFGFHATGLPHNNPPPPRITEPLQFRRAI